MHEDFTECFSNHDIKNPLAVKFYSLSRSQFTPARRRRPARRSPRAPRHQYQTPVNNLKRFSPVEGVLYKTFIIFDGKFIVLIPVTISVRQFFIQHFSFFPYFFLLQSPIACSPLYHYTPWISSVLKYKS